jgi:hypothetical protein
MAVSANLKAPSFQRGLFSWGNQRRWFSRLRLGRNLFRQRFPVRAGFTTCGIQSCYNYREAADIFRVPLAVHWEAICHAQIQRTQKAKKIFATTTASNTTASNTTASNTTAATTASNATAATVIATTSPKTVVNAATSSPSSDDNGKDRSVSTFLGLGPTRRARGAWSRPRTATEETTAWLGSWDAHRGIRQDQNPFELTPLGLSEEVKAINHIEQLGCGTDNWDTRLR